MNYVGIFLISNLAPPTSPLPQPLPSFLYLFALVTLNRLLGRNVLVCALSMWSIVADTLRFSGCNFARNPNSAVQTTSSYNNCEYNG